jgi:hypothetical protein
MKSGLTVAVTVSLSVPSSSSFPAGSLLPTIELFSGTSKCFWFAALQRGRAYGAEQRP